MVRGPLPAELKPKDVTAVMDSREQLPLGLSPLACIGRERERFDREIQQLLAYAVRAIVVDAGWQFFERGEWRGNIKSNQAIGWITAGVPIVMACDHEQAGRFVAWILYIAARRCWDEARALAATIGCHLGPIGPAGLETTTVSSATEAAS